MTAIGTGFSGIGAAIKLQKQGFNDHIIHQNSNRMSIFYPYAMDRFAKEREPLDLSLFEIAGTAQ